MIYGRIPARHNSLEGCDVLLRSPLAGEKVFIVCLNTLDQSLLVEFGRHGLEDLLGQTVLEFLDGDGAIGVSVHGVEEGVEVEGGLEAQHFQRVLDLVP